MPDSLPRGQLKIYLGYAAGVGKTYRMLEDAHALSRTGVDVVVGYFEPHGRKDTIAIVQGLEIIPRRKVAYRGLTFEEMDAAAILRRKPAVCVVDEFPHSNVPGSERGKRWEDVETLLEAGIDVFTTMNVQHLESLNDQVWQFTGVRVRETIPDWVVQSANEVVMVDLPPDALLNRLRRGAIYPLERARQATQNFFRESSLEALRELALRQTAYEVDLRSEQEAQRAALRAPAGTASEGNVRPPADKILICVSDDPATAAVIRRGRRVADYLQADCVAVYVQPGNGASPLPAAKREAVEQHLNFARSLHIDVRLIQGDDVARSLVDFARLNQVTHIFMTRTEQAPWLRMFHRNLVQRVAQLADDMQVTIVSKRGLARTPQTETAG
jgi:two-component system sensor histidine kinase KdpD